VRSARLNAVLFYGGASDEVFARGRGRLPSPLLHNLNVGRTRKDSKQGNTLKVAKRADGTFDLFLNCSLDRDGIAEEGLSEELCVRFGFCGEEYDSILTKLHQNGIVTLTF